MAKHSFKPNDLVDVVNLGKDWQRRYPARVVGVYGVGAYIVQWDEASPFPDDPWPCRVFVKACVLPRLSDDAKVA